METVPFPATLEIDYPDREFDRLTTVFRLFTVIPIAVILALLTRANVHADSANYVFGSGGIVFLGTVLMLLFRQKYPRWWFDWNLALTRFGTRVQTADHHLLHVRALVKAMELLVSVNRLPKDAGWGTIRGRCGVPGRLRLRRWDGRFSSVYSTFFACRSTAGSGSGGW